MATLETTLSPKAKENLQKNAELRQKGQQIHQVAARRKESPTIQSREITKSRSGIQW